MSQLDYVPPEVVPIITATLNQSNTQIHGIISFYHHFLTHKPELNKISICRAESCQAMCSAGWEKDSKQRLTFAHRMLMEGDPLVLIEGLLIAGLVVDATQGYIYLRSEYPKPTK
jgi:NADH:ubiquinone oxidoreductase subunit E